MREETIGHNANANDEVAALRSVIRENLNRFVDERGVTPGELAKAAGVSRRAAVKWLSGESGIDVNRIKSVCDFLEVPVHSLLGEESSYTEVRLESRKALEMFESLDDAGQAKVVDYMGDLAASGRYNRSAS